MRFPGILPAVTTPFDAAGAVDVDALQANVHALLDAGVHGIVGTGTMGEAGSLSAAERRTVIAAIAEAVDGRVPVVAGVSASTAEQAGAYAKDAAAAGAVAMMCLPPLGYRGDESEVEAFFAGDDWALEGFCAGATGWVSGVAVVAPAECVALYEHCRAGELGAARAVYARLLPVARFDMTPKLVQYFKAAQDAVGLAGGPTRPPRLPLSDDERAALDEALAKL